MLKNIIFLSLATQGIYAATVKLLVGHEQKLYVADSYYLLYHSGYYQSLAVHDDIIAGVGRSKVLFGTIMHPTLDPEVFVHVLNYMRTGRLYMQQFQVPVLFHH